MKLMISLVCSFLIFTLSGFGQDKSFAFKGQVHFNSTPLKGVTIEVYDAGDLVYEALSKGAGKFAFELKAEREYHVEVSMEDFRSKTIWINTKRTKDLTVKVPTFTFDVYLKKEKITPYDELSEIPVTLIKYNTKRQEFYMDKAYEEAVKNKKKRLKENTLQGR